MKSRRPRVVASPRGRVSTTRRCSTCGSATCGCRSRARGSTRRRAAALRRTAAQGHPLPAARLAVRGMVLAGRHSRHRDSVLPGASAAAAARAPLHARGGGRQRQVADAHPAARDRPRDRHRLPAAPAQVVARRVRQGLAALSVALLPAARQPALRAAPRPLVRAEPSHRGFRRDLRRLAAAALALAQPVRGLAGAAQARVRRRDDARPARGGAPCASVATSSSRSRRTPARCASTIAASSAATSSTRHAPTTAACCACSARPRTIPDAPAGQPLPAQGAAAGRAPDDPPCENASLPGAACPQDRDRSAHGA